MGYAKEPGGWGEKADTVPVDTRAKEMQTREMSAADQAPGTRDRTRQPEEAFPRDVDEGMGRHARRDQDGPDSTSTARH